MMNKKYLMNGFAALALIASVSSCTKDVTTMSQSEIDSKAKENAELQLGFTIPDGQSWVMASQVTANVAVNLKAGETYTVAIYSNNPIIDGKGVVLAKGSVTNGNSFIENFTCGDDCDQLYVGVTDKNNYTLYKAVKVENGKVNADFSEATAESRRSITVKGDVYTKFPSPTDVATYFPTAIPATAKTDAELEAMYVGQTVKNEDGTEYKPYGWPVTMSDMYAVYLNVVGKTEKDIKVTTPGEFSLGHTYANPANQTYNLYIAVGAGNSLTLKRSGAEHVNIYILSGNITIDSSFGECAGIISAASGVTVNDQRNHVAHNDGIKIYNRGTWNATNTNNYWNGKAHVGYDIGNFCTFYNEGTLNVTGALSYSPGDANTSYLVNYGSNAVLTAPSMTLNSSGNFFNSGTATITGETNVTQSGIYWVNNGKYTTGSMVFSAKNATFYNYCQLKVTGNAHMYDGEFNLMTDSYCEAGSADFDNFIVNMANNAGFKVIGNTTWGAQGDGTYQGVKATGSKAYVYFGGTTTVAGHLRSMEFTGNVTFAHGDIVDLGAGNSGVQPTYVLTNEGVTEVNKSDATFTAPTGGQCSGTWNQGGTPKYETMQVYTYAFEDQTVNTDYDMNDVVLKVNYHVTEQGTGANAGKVIYDKTKLDVKLVAAGATFNIKVKIGDTYLFGGKEIHDALNVDPGVMVNTGSGSQTANPAVENGISIPAGWNNDFTKLPVSIEVLSTSTTYVFPNTDLYPHAVMVPTDWAWPQERVNVQLAYPGTSSAEKVTIGNVEVPNNSFRAWGGTPAASRTSAMNGWYNNPASGKVVSNN